MRTFRAKVPDEMQVTTEFIKNIPGIIAFRVFAFGAYSDNEFKELKEEVERQLESLQDFFISKFHHLEFVHLILMNREFIVLRDKRTGDFYFELFFEEVK